MGDSPKWVKSGRRRGKKKERERERLNNGEKHASTHGARKPPGPKLHIFNIISHHMANPAIMTHSMAISFNNCPSKLRVAWKYAELTPTRIRRNQMR